MGKCHRRYGDFESKGEEQRCSVLPACEQRLDTDVVNLGQAAYGLKQELGVLRRFALPLRPRLVLWFLFGGNDLRDVELYEWQKRNLETASGAASPKPVSRASRNGSRRRRRSSEFTTDTRSVRRRRSRRQCCVW